MSLSFVFDHAGCLLFSSLLYSPHSLPTTYPFLAGGQEGFVVLFTVSCWLLATSYHLPAGLGGALVLVGDCGCGIAVLCRIALGLFLVC
ncbi:hypothetical protein IWX46DRAFT_592227 [Phyllosticta citricarpa]|uniref:NADH dehydrogenase subunit 6 n=1 Tax=Phyllosticta citricarpa TaxID=55181 RepID=A0ABR1MLK7_9PEZI